MKILDLTEEVNLQEKKLVERSNFLKATESTTIAAKINRFQHIGDSRKNVAVIGTSTIKYPTGNKISKKNHTKIKASHEQQQKTLLTM